MSLERAAEVLAVPSRSGVRPWAGPPAAAQLHDLLCQVHAQGWAIADNELAPGVRAIAVPVRDGSGEVRAAMNVTVNAGETEIRTLVDEYLPLLREAAAAIEADWARWQSRPQSEIPAS
jgi:IclR family pca regulon transcriptional regulator